MATGTQAVLAVLPLAAIATLMVALYQPATRTMPVAWAIAVVVGFVGWDMSPELIGAATIAGVFTATLLAGTVIWYRSRPMGVTGGVVVVVAVGLYTVHRYEQVTAGLVER
jgi:hypothetical protein